METNMAIVVRDENEQTDSLATVIRERREAEGMKQLTLAALAGVSERTIQRLEAGCKMDGRTVRRIARVLGFDENNLASPVSKNALPPDQLRANMMKTYFEEMARYDRWANERLLTWMEARPENAELTQTFSHLVAENDPWLYLLRGETVPSDVNPEPAWSLAECRKNLGPTMDAIASYVAAADDDSFSAKVSSRSPAGHTFENSALEVLTNMLGHSEHHRGQMVAAIARDFGEYVPTAYMSYLRCRP